MEQVRYADSVREPRPDSHGRDWHERDSLDRDSLDRDFEGRESHDGFHDRTGEAALDSLMQRAVAEQLAEQRLIHDALTDFDRRLERFEHAITERLDGAEREGSDRLEGFERDLGERMAAVESVMTRVVDRLSSAEDRILDAVQHNERVMTTQVEGLRAVVDGAIDRLASALDDAEDVTRAQLDGIREAMVTALERVADAVAQNERVVRAQLEAVKPTVEAAVLGSVNPEIERAVDDVRAGLGALGRRLTRDVHRVTAVVRSGGDPYPGFEPVSEHSRLRHWADHPVDAQPDEIDLDDDSAGEPTGDDAGDEVWTDPLERRRDRRGRPRRERPLRARPEGASDVS